MMEKIPAAILEDLALPAGLSLRAWAEADLETIQRLSAAEGWTTPAEWPVETLEAWRHSWPALVICEEENIIAFLRALSDGQVTAYICELLVVPPWRGRGLGKLLIEACHKLQPAVRYDLLSTEEADGFYQHLGFRPFQGYRKSYH
jgi:GNAT superfamily N-acetyltransferase